MTSKSSPIRLDIMDFKSATPKISPSLLKAQAQGRLHKPGVIGHHTDDHLAPMPPARISASQIQRSPFEGNLQFRQWFANSHVVDELGRPKVVQHATTHEFDRFDVSKIGGGYNRFGPGFYFTDGCFKTLQCFAGEEGRMINAYLSLQNPITSGAMDVESIHRFFDALHDEVFENGFDARETHREVKLECLREPEYAFDKICAAASNFITQEDWFRSMKAAGFDGVMRPVHGVMEYVLLDPRQIKSTTNNGNFDPLNDRYDA